MSNVRVTVDSGDLASTIANLAHIPRQIRNRAIRIGLNKAGSVVRNSISAPVETGALQKSFSVKVKQTRAGDWHMTVGTNRRAGVRKSKKVTRSMFGFFKSLVATPKPSRQSRKPKRKPSRYLHLVNNGTKRGVIGRLFMQRAAMIAGPAAIVGVKEKILSELSAAANRR